MHVTPWTDRDGRPRAVAEPPAEGAFYQPIGDFQRASYERNAFARGTEQEVVYLADALAVRPGCRLVDVGCGTGRHARAFAARGADVVGVDVSHGLLATAAAAAPCSWVQGDARRLPLPSACADIVLCLCQGGFGLLSPRPGVPDDEVVLGELARILRPGGRLALTAYSAWFAARFPAPEDSIDVARSASHHRGEVRGPDAERRIYDLWTTSYTPPHLALLVRTVGLELEAISGIAPGAYGDEPPRITHPELLVRAVRPQH